MHRIAYVSELREHVNFLQLEEYKESDTSDDSENEDMETEELGAEDEGIFYSSLTILVLIDSNHIANHLICGQIRR